MGYLICCWSLTNFMLVFQYSIGIIVSIIRKLRCIDTETDKTLWEKGATKLAARKSSNILKLDKLLLFLRFADETLSITGIPNSEKSLRNIPWFWCLSLEAILGLSDSPKSYQIFIYLRLPATERSAARTVRQCSGILSGGHWTRTFDSGLVQGSLRIAWIDSTSSEDHPVPKDIEINICVTCTWPLVVQVVRARSKGTATWPIGTPNYPIQ